MEEVCLEASDWPSIRRCRFHERGVHDEVDDVCTWAISDMCLFKLPEESLSFLKMLLAGGWTLKQVPHVCVLGSLWLWRLSD